MKDLNPHIEDLIVRYLSEGLDPMELKELQNWISASPLNRDYFVRKQEISFASICVKDDKDTFNKDEAFARFQDRVKKSKKKDKPIITMHHIWSRAAVVLVLLGACYISYWQGGKHVNRRLANKISVEAPLGSKTKLYLPDGTLVWLNAGSKISYSQNFGIVTRDVEVVGEAYFEVTKNKKIPFNVKSKEINVQVLGTKFNFSNYADDKEAVVALLEGKVSFVDAQEKNAVGYLTPNQKVILDKKSGNTVVSAVKAVNASEWKNGFLFFDEELLEDITKELERSYNVKIEIKNEFMKSSRFYGNFIRREQSIKEILDILASTGKMNYIIKSNGNIIIY